MPIIHMCHDLSKLPAGAVNVSEYDGNGRTEGAPKLWLYESHVGLCISDYERNGYNDSDFYMIVWNPEKQAPESIEFASTRGWSYPCYGSRPDATPEVLAAYAAYEAEAERKHREREAEAAAKRPERGKVLQVVRGRKVPKGTTGVCIWVGDGRWGRRVGIKDNAGQVHWTAISNVEVSA